MNKNLILIRDDFYFISERIKTIDKEYIVFFNTDTKRYEVHLEGEDRNTYCFTSPYEELDERTLFWAIKTRRENSDKIIAEIEKNNQEIYEKNIKDQVNQLKEVLCS